ncbi:MAG TPA: nitroreductase family protein [Defluviitaleaceae bacterium]|nr:NAD(P)H nitroreductase [Candidatus Epulonipiscium sp.]HOQ16526.1 nitroreductase family protein [Defluviitaleaceae bacterium]HPT75644.1 nitroreductase family protein [Defluviitaleaceae bacterium]HQD50169.1 nitroreductase family protein [Defluviitaleaceae bacterium]
MFFDLLKKRRSIRKYINKKIEKEKVDMIIKSALMSPSSRGRRPWEFVLVEDRDLLEKLSNCREHGSQFLKEAALAVVVLADPDKCDVWIEDASIASLIIQLTAHSLDLGSCWIQVRERYKNEFQKTEDYIKELLDIPPDYCVESIIAIGYPGEEKEAHDENNLSMDKVHYNKYNIKYS